MTAQHTPGPWIDGCGINGECIIFQRNADKYMRPEDVNEEWQANMRLLDAAPDLLEALESICLWMEDQADGQSKGGHATFDLMMLREHREIARAAIAKATGGAI